MEKEISWQAQEFIEYPKSAWWYVIVSLVGLGLATYFLWQKDFLTAVLFLLIYIIILFFARAKPKTIHITLDDHGVKFNDMKIPYLKIKKFWIIYDPPEVKTINFETTAYLNSYLTLQLADQDPVKIREFLLNYLSEDIDREEQISDKFSRTFKF